MPFSRLFPSFPSFSWLFPAFPSGKEMGFALAKAVHFSCPAACVLEQFQVI
jgi:hypothetical protein